MEEDKAFIDKEMKCFMLYGNIKYMFCLEYTEIIKANIQFNQEMYTICLWKRTTGFL